MVKVCKVYICGLDMIMGGLMFFVVIMLKF